VSFGGTEVKNILYSKHFRFSHLVQVTTLTAKDDLSFLCVCDDVTQVSRVLEALHFKMPGSTTRRVFATVKLGANGVRFTIEETQQFQANGTCRFIY
jgi:hypothetical protein